MKVKYLGDGQPFEFSRDFGFTGSAQGGKPPLAHADNPNPDEFGDGSYVSGQALKRGGPVKRAFGGPMPVSGVQMPGMVGQGPVGGGPIAIDPAQRIAMAQHEMHGMYPPGGGPLSQPAPMMRPGQAMPGGPGMHAPAMAAKGGLIKKAIKRPGALTRKADAAGESVSEFASAHEHDKGLTGHQARFYEGVLKPASKHRKG